MRGEQVRSLRVDWRGAGGDRTHAVVHEHKGQVVPLTAREAPTLLAWQGMYPFAPDAGLDPADPPAAQIVDPRGSRMWWTDPLVKRRLSDALGREVGLRRDTTGQQDLGRSLLVTVGASLRALEQELDVAIDGRRFRSNLHLELDAEPWAELGWAGRTLRVDGGVVLRLLHPCERCVIPTRDPDTQVKWPELLRHLAARHGQCFGINARVVVAGRMAVGQAVEVA
jgi:uncharacterized protein YcbX